MPWTVKNDPEGCSREMPWSVVKLNDGQIVGCHATQDAAEAQVAALYAGESGEGDSEEARQAMDVQLAREKLDAAIELHEEHLEDPATATPDSQNELMALIMAAREALGDGGEMSSYHGVEEMSRGAAPVHHTETMEGSWDAGMQVGRLPSPMSTSAAARMYAWYDSGEVSDGKIEKQYCKLPHHAVSESGSPGAAVMNGVRNALARLNQTEMPDSEREAARRHLRAHLDDGPDSNSDRREEPEMSETVTEEETSTVDVPEVVEETEVVSEEETEEISEEEAPPEEESEDTSSEDEDSEEEGETEQEVEVEQTHGNRAWAEARISAVPASPIPITNSVRNDQRRLPEPLRERLEAHGVDVGVVDRVSRGLFELRFRPEFRFNDDGSVFLHGYATVYGHPYEVMGGPPYGWVETIMHRACDVSVTQGADVRLLVNHDGIALARTRSGTLRLESDEIGLYSCAPNLDMRSPAVQSLVSAMQRGDMDEMSFAFRAVQQEWNDDYTERQITEVKLYDVSVVTYPANPATVTAIRDEPTGGPSYPGSLALAQADQIRMRGRGRLSPTN